MRKPAASSLTCPEFSGPNRRLRPSTRTKGCLKCAADSVQNLIGRDGLSLSPDELVYIRDSVKAVAPIRVMEVKAASPDASHEALRG